jgi:hypothetical protein
MSFSYEFAFGGWILRENCFDLIVSNLPEAAVELAHCEEIRWRLKAYDFVGLALQSFETLSRRYRRRENQPLRMLNLPRTGGRLG